jgi:Arc/MetJ-type ribon-helix-helix transcriptional regulator
VSGASSGQDQPASAKDQPAGGQDQPAGAKDQPARAQDQPAGGRQIRAADSVLSGLEDALRQALATVPRDQVVKCVMTALPVEVLVDEGARLHGKVRKVSVSMPEELAEKVRTRTGAGGFSRYVAEAVQEQVRLDLLDDLAAELEAEYGPVDPKLVEQAMREWPDYEGD